MTLFDFDMCRTEYIPDFLNTSVHFCQIKYISDFPFPFVYYTHTFYPIDILQVLGGTTEISICVHIPNKIPYNFLNFFNKVSSECSPALRKRS